MTGKVKFDKCMHRKSLVIQWYGLISFTRRVKSSNPLPSYSIQNQ